MTSKEKFEQPADAVTIETYIVRAKKQQIGCNHRDHHNLDEAKKCLSEIQGSHGLDWEISIVLESGLLDLRTVPLKE